MRLISVAVCSLLLAALILLPRSRPAKTPHATTPAVDAYGKLPLSFEANQGQTDKRVKFLSRGPGYALFLTSTDAVLSLKARNGQRTKKDSVLPVSTGPKSSASEAAVLRIRLEHANRNAMVSGIDELASKSNYFIGNDPAKWRRNIPTFGGVKYQQVYSGVDLVYYGNQRQLEYDFVLAPNADPKQIELSFAGAERLRLDAAGNLVVSIAGGEVVEHTPVIYQDIDGMRRRVAGGYEFRTSDTVGFKLAAYDHRERLTIDPSLVYSTYLGGTSQDIASGITVDSSGDAYVVGGTQSTNFPTTSGALQTSLRGVENAFVTKLNPAGTGVVYSTYLGGSGIDAAEVIAVDASGNAYVTGQTNSSNFPTTPTAFQTSLGGGSDAWVAKLDPTGSALIYSTYLGGSNDEFGGSGIAVNSLGNAYIGGSTRSSNFPTTAGAFQTSLSGDQNSTVTELNPTGSGLVYSTYLGGSGTGFQDGAFGIAVDGSGNAYVTGDTDSADFPVTIGSFQTTFGGGTTDAYVTKFNPTGTGLVYSTLVGGNGRDDCHGLALDATGNVYVAGATGSTNFPTTSGAFQTAFGGGSFDIFVTKLNASGSALVYSTYLGGSGDDQNAGQGDPIAIDSSGNAYLTGRTNSTNFPTTPTAFQSTLAGGFDAFVTEVNATGSGLVSSSYLGGTGEEFGLGIALDSEPSPNVYVTGLTASTDFPTTSGAFQTAFGGGSYDGFVTKISGTPILSCNTISISGSMDGNLPIAAGSTVQAGYDFTMPGSHPDAHVTFNNASVTLQVTCPDNSVHPLTITLPTQTYDDPLNSSAWLPSGDQNSPLVYQGSTISNVCGTQTGHAPQGATFSAQVCSDDFINKVNVRFHYSDNSSGGWSGTKTVIP